MGLPGRLVYTLDDTRRLWFSLAGYGSRDHGPLVFRPLPSTAWPRLEPTRADAHVVSHAIRRQEEHQSADCGVRHSQQIQVAGPPV